MKHFLSVILVILPFLLLAQKEFHVFPEGHITSPGSSNGDGSLSYPWDLQTALSKPSEEVNGGDTIWLHEGIYNGKFVSTLSSNRTGQKIVISPFKNDKVVLNGNISSNLNSVLQVIGKGVIFKDFTITHLGQFSRNKLDKEFKRTDGINHNDGDNCEFINLKIHNNPGSGFGSWQHTGNTKIEGCYIYNNGFYSGKRGSGVGIYVQNSSEDTRLIKNNFIFNNYYKGIEAWSANKNAKHEYVKNIDIIGNIIFNNGISSNAKYDNIIVATDDRNTTNIARNIKVLNNVLYHNTNFVKNEVGGSAPSLTLGFNTNAPVKNIVVSNNVIIGRNNGLRLLHVKSLKFENNTVYSGYVFLDQLLNDRIDQYHFDNNKYFTKNTSPFRVNNSMKFSLNDWQSNFNIDKMSYHKHIKNFELNNVLNITKINSNTNRYTVTLFDKLGDTVEVDFSNYNIDPGSRYFIENIESDDVVDSGFVSDSRKVSFPMGTYNQTENNFGVYVIEFVEDDKSIKQKKGLFKRLFGWLF